MLSYICIKKVLYNWYLYGKEKEEEDVMELIGNYMEGLNVHVPGNAFEHRGQYIFMVIDFLHQEGMYDEVEDIEEEPNSVAKKLYDMLERGKQELWSGYKTIRSCQQLLECEI